MQGRQLPLEVIMGYEYGIISKNSNSADFPTSIPCALLPKAIMFVNLRGEQGHWEKSWTGMKIGSFLPEKDFEDSQIYERKAYSVRMTVSCWRDGF